MTFSSYRKETKAIFTSLKIMNIYELIALFKYFHMVFFPQTSMNIFQKIKPNTITTCTRSASKVHINYQRTDYGKFTSRGRVPTDYFLSKGYSYLRLNCKNLSNQKATANTVSTTRKTTLHQCGMRLKYFYLSKMLYICPFLFEKKNQ